MKKTKIVIISVVLGLSMGSALQFGLINSIENGTMSFFNGVFPNNVGTRVDSSKAGNAVYLNNPGYRGSQKTYFDRNLQTSILSSSFGSIDGGFSQQTVSSVAVTGNTYFDFESGISSTTSFSTADFFWSNGKQMIIDPVNGALAKSVGIVPMNSVDQNTYQNTKLAKNNIKGDPPTWKVANNTVFVWQTAENNAVKMRLDNFDNPLLLTYDGIYSISIDGNQDFLAKASTYGWTGDGSATNPIVIENYNIASSQFGALSIYNTNLYFVVKNNVFDGQGSSLNGVVLDNVTNGVFTSNTVKGYNVGILAVYSPNLSFSFNTISGNSAEGVSVGNSNNFAFSNNTVENNGGSGLLVYQSSGSSVDSNIFTGNSIDVSNDPSIISGAVSLVYSTGSVTNNIISANNGNGVLFFGANGSSATGNTVSTGSQDGISVIGSDNVLVDSNTLDGNVGRGVSVSSSIYTTVSNNVVLNNGQDGIYWVNSSFGSVTDNTLTGNSNLALQYAKTGSLQVNVYSGLFMDPSYFNTVDGNNVTGNGVGIYLEGSEFNTFSNNKVTNNAQDGFSIVDSSSNVVTTNTFSGNSNPNTLLAMNSYLKLGSLQVNVYSGLFMDPSENNTVSNNVFNSNYGYGFHVQASNKNTFDSNTVTSNGLDGAFVENSNWNTISNNDFSKNSNLALQLDYAQTMKASSLQVNVYSGLFMDPSYNNTIVNNNFDSNYGNGLRLLASDSNIVQSNNMTNNAQNGLFVEDSNINNIVQNTITGNSNPALLNEMLSYGKPNGLTVNVYSGLFMDPSGYNNVKDNVITNNYGYGTWLQGSDSNAVDNNSITGNGADGVFVQDSNYNSITNNFISSNSNPALQLELANVLNNFKPDSLQVNVYSGLFMDPSIGNYVANNKIVNNPGYGVWVQSSSENVFDSNSISNSGYDGFFLENSNYNNVTSNNIFSSGNTAVLNAFLSYAKPTSLNVNVYSGLFMDPSIGNLVAYNNISSNSGFGVHALDSDSNALGYNQISYNSLQGLYSVNSSSMTIMANSFAYNIHYAAYFDLNSHSSHVTGNDFVANAQGYNESQAYDDGGNTFQNNFLLDANPNSAYSIDGSASSRDPSPAYVPIGNLNSYDFPPVHVSPKLTTVSFNLDSTGQYMDAHIYFPTGYSAYLTNSTTIFAEWNGHYYPMLSVNAQSTSDLHVKFDRQALAADVYNYFVTNGITTATITINFTGEFNGGFMAFYGADTTAAFY